MAHSTLQVGGGLLESVGELAAIAGTFLLLLMLVGLGGFAYKSLRGDGIEWPEDREDDDTVSRGNDDDEWKYY